MVNRLAPWVPPLLVALSGCSSVPPAAPSRAEASSPSPPAPVPVLAPAAKGRLIRTTGIVQAAKALSVRVPQIAAQQSRLTLARLVPNGTRVRQGDTLVEFDKTGLLDEQREAIGKLGDIEHQVSERRARARSDATKRVAQIREAEADLAKAGIQLQKGPVLNQIERRKNEVKAESAKARVASLEKSHKFHELEEAAAVAVLQRKFERQQVMLERIQNNLERLDIRAPHDGMIALENTWRSGSMGPPQEGDQVIRANRCYGFLTPPPWWWTHRSTSLTLARSRPMRRPKFILTRTRVRRLTACLNRRLRWPPQRSNRPYAVSPRDSG